jgi:hypothetical protein
MLKLSPVALAFAAGLACAAAPAVGGQTPEPAASVDARQASDLPVTWAFMIMGFASAGALLRWRRRFSGEIATA